MKRLLVSADTGYGQGPRNRTSFKSTAEPGPTIYFLQKVMKPEKLTL